MEGIELICFQMISFNGFARSCFIEAIKSAKGGDFERAIKLMEEGENHFSQGHEVHSKLIQQDASGETSQITLLLIHAEDQMMSAETLKIVAEEMIDLYKRLIVIEKGRLE